MNGRTSLAKPGRGTVLGEVGERKLMAELAEKAAKGWAYSEAEVYDLIRLTCIDRAQGRCSIDPRNKRPYTAQSKT